MSFIYTLEELHTHLKFTAKGSPSTLQEMFTYVNHVGEKARVTDCNRVLVDERLADIKPEFHKAIHDADLPNHEMFEGKDLRVALIYPPERMKSYKLFEAALKSPTFQLRVFDTVRAGLDWLEID